jgi:methyltransferase (TIGR00027 family)
MEQTRASLTALGAALMRAAHTRLDPSPLINDPWGDRIVLEAEREAVLSVVLQSLSAQDRERCEKLGDRNAVLDAALQLHPGYGWAVLRARYAEDALETAVGRGVHQYVIVGAGFDSFALRQPPFARHVLVFEVDHPATQGVKRERLHGCDVPLPHTLHLVPADLSHEQLADALARSAFRPTEPTFFAWLGVTQYLTREANLATLRGIAGCSAPGSQLVFTYLEQSELAGDRASGGGRRVQAAFAAAREPWVSGFDPSRLGEDLAAIGFTLIEDLDGLDAKARYCPGRDLSPMKASHIVHTAIHRQAGQRGILKCR